MKKRWLVLVASFALLLLLVAWGGGWFEPRYQGKRASAYVFEVLDTPRFSTGEATNKLQAMGAKLAVPPLIKALQYEDSVFRQKYATAHAKAPKFLQKFLPRPRSVQHLRRNAITALTVFGPDAAPAVPALIRIHDKSDVYQRNSMTYTLAAIGPGARAAVPLLLNELTNAAGQRFPPFAILRALGAIDATGELSAHEVIPCTSHRDFSTSIAAVDALGAMSRATPSLATNLWRLVRAGVSTRFAPNTRDSALRNLNALGLLTRDALDPYFLELTNNLPSQRLAAMAVVTFSTNFSSELVPVLCHLARKDPDHGVSDGAFHYLLRYGAQTNVAPQLREEALFLHMRGRSGNEPNWAAMDAIRSLAPHGASLVPLLARVLTNADPRMRGKAAEALAQIGPAASNAAPQLRPLLRDEWLFVREAATNALRADGVTP
jgi:HEAT repeat protein